MAKDPAFLFYSQDFIVGVQTMNFEDRGKYITILSQMHQQGRMDEETIRFMVGSVSDKLRLKFKVDDNGLWYNERLESETEKRNHFTETRRQNGNLGGRPKKEKPIGKPNGKPTDNHKGNLMGNENEIVNEDEIVIDNVLKEAFDEIYLGNIRPNWGHIDFEFELKAFCEKVMGSPSRYKDRDTDGIRLALQAQLRSAKSKPKQQNKLVQ